MHCPPSVSKAENTKKKEKILGKTPKTVALGMWIHIKLTPLCSNRGKEKLENI